MSLPLNVVIDIVINVLVVEVVAGLQTLLTRSDLNDIKKKDVDLVKLHTSKPSPVLRIIKTAEEQCNDFI